MDTYSLLLFCCCCSDAIYDFVVFFFGIIFNGHKFIAYIPRAEMLLISVHLPFRYQNKYPMDYNVSSS